MAQVKMKHFFCILLMVLQQGKNIKAATSTTTSAGTTSDGTTTAGTTTASTTTTSTTTTGTTTTVVNCTQSPCKNGATCSNTTLGDFCICPDGFGGIHCEENVTNAAMGSNTILSSTHSPFVPGNAVDGDTSQSASMQSCAVTFNQANPWILVDLGAVHTITHIKVFNRLDCCTSQMLNLVLLTGTTTSSISVQQTLGGPIGSTAVFNLFPYVSARYVKLQINGVTALHVCEIEVYTINVPRCSGQQYNPSIQLCCENSIFDLNNNHTACCGQSTYDTIHESCSNGYVLSHYNPSFMLCDGVLKDIMFDNSCCCGTELFDATTNVCCNGQVRARFPYESFCCKCKDPRLDLALVIDMSEGLSDAEIQQLMDLIENIIQALQADIDNGNIRVALIIFTDEVFVEFQLTNNQTAADMITHLNSVPLRSGGTRTDKALATLYNDIFNTTNDERSDVQNVALILTDGNSNDVLQTVTEADNAKNAGIRLVVTAVGTDIGTFEVDSIASDPSSENVYHVGYFANLANIGTHLIQIFFDECADTPVSPMCGGVEYDPVTQVCCGVIIVNVTNPFERECCGTALYNSTTHSCCSYNTVYDTSTHICCGGTTYDNGYQCCNNIHSYLPAAHICCIDALQPLHGAGSTACCDRVSYDTTCHTCSNGTVALNFDETTELCCDGNIQQKLYAYSCCCGQNVFDAAFHTCCNGQVVNRTASDDDHCCHCINEMVDIALVLDLSESVHDQAAKHASLMSFAKNIIDDSDIPNMRFSVITFTHEVFVEFLLYEYSTAQDMKNKIDLIPVRSGGTNTGDAINALYTLVFNDAYGDRDGAPNVAVIITDGQSNNNAHTLQQAAIAKNMDIHIITIGIGMTDMSELNQIASSPAAENVFSSTDFNHLFSIIDVIEDKFKEECTDIPVMLFCGSYSYDPKVHVCCNGHLVTITNVNATQCCGNYPWITLYDNADAACCNGVVIPITIPGYQSCCGSYSLYNPAIQQCCGGNAISLNEGCCGGNVPYNPIDQICCNGTVNPFHGQGTTACCGTTSYDNQCNNCVNNVVVLGYDEATEMCCNGNIQNKTYHLSCCCGSYVINAVNYTCCGGVPISRPPSDTSNCCHCINRMVDVAILVDASESVYNVPGNINLLLNFVKDIISDSAVDSGDVRFAVTLFNHVVYNYFYLNTHNNVSQMLADITSTQLPLAGGTATGLALEHLHSQIFLESMGDRSTAPNMAIVITDGQSSDNALTVTHATILKQQGVHVIAVGIGSNMDLTELKQIASDPSFENVFHVDDFNGLLTIEGLIEQKFIEDCTETPVMPLCGTVSYNPTVHVCCQGHLISIVNTSATQCCGSHSWTALYDPSDAVCCNGVVITMTEQGQDSCCGASFLYNSLTQKCCGGYPVSMTQECCGNNHPFDPSSEICCNGTVNPLHGIGTTECCQTVSYDTKCNQCINGVVVLGYNEATEMCCEGVIHYKEYEYSCCCGTGVINALNFTCCGGVSMPRSPSDSSLCCHCINRLLDVAIIADISESIASTPNNIFYLLDFIKHLINSSAVDSGDVRFALSLYSHQVYNYFNFNTHLYAEQMIADINATPLPNYGGTNTGGALQHLHSQVFQGSQGDRTAAPNIAIVITDGKSSDNAYTVQQANILKSQGVHVIVVGIGSLTDTVELHQIASDPTFENIFNVDDFNTLFTIQSVIEEKFVEECKVIPETPYCGYQQYNPFQYACCNGHLVAMTDPTKNQCCGYGAYATLYNSVNQVCCNGHVLNIITQGSNMCCGGSLYNHYTEKCCGETVISSNLECCGNTSSFNSATHICCNGSVQQSHGLGTTACCGTQSYDTRCDQCNDGIVGLRYDEMTELCCDGVVSQKLYSHSCCCGSNVIDASVVTCCNGVPEPKPTWDNSLCCHCINRKIDLAIVADMSESVNDVTDKADVVLDFIISIINNSDIDTGNVHIAVSIFTHDIQNLFFLNSYYTRQDMINDIQATQISFGGTNTGDALKNLYTTVFTSIGGDRSEAPNIAIVVTDGKSNNETDTMIQAAEVKARGIHVIGVGIGLTDMTELNVIASPPSHQNVFNVDSFFQLNSIIDDIEAMFVENCTDTPDLLYCGLMQYDPHVHVCCGGNLLPVTDQNARRCCGSHLFDDTSAVCCDGYVIPILNAGQTSCCGSSSLYNPLMQKCCGGNVISITMDCCGSALSFNNATQICCQGTVQPMHGIGTTSCCGMQSYDTRCNQCSQTGVILGYDEESELCCNGVINQRLYTYSCCCGQTVIDASVNTCCEGTIIERPHWDDSLCCHCTSRKIDIAFAVDFSESVHDYSADVTYLVDFVKNLIDLTDVDTNTVRVALSVYTHDVLNYFFLNTYQTRAEMLNFIESASFPQGGTNTGAALKNLYTNVFTTYRGDRLDAPNIAVFITDGKSNNNTDTVLQSTLLKQTGVHVIVIGIAMTDTNELHQIASEPTSENVFNVSDFNQLFSLEDMIKSKFTEDCTETPETLFCGDAQYDPRAHVCCDEELIVITSPNARTCCGVSGLYDEMYAVCCNGNIIQITGAGKTTCCGETALYDPSKETCCDGVVQSTSTECCSNEKVDVAIVADSSESIVMSDYHFEMLWSLIENIIMQADVETGNVRLALTVYTHKVFNEFLLNKYNTVANMIEHINDSPIRSGSTNTARAIKNLYTDVFKPTSGDRKQVQNIAIVITDGESDNTTETIEQANRARSLGISITAVGINVKETLELYEMASTPKEENVFVVNDHNDVFDVVNGIQMKLFNQCNQGHHCGGVAYDVHEYICCNGNVQIRYNGDNTKCCRGQSYDSRHSVCCNGDIMAAIYGQSTKCCGKQVFDPSKNICCADKLRPKSGPSTECCGTTTFESNCFKCNSKDTIVPRFNEKTSVCCNGNIMARKYGDNSCCCGRKQIDLSKKACCDGRPRKVPQSSPCACCGERLFNVKKQICCRTKRKRLTYGHDSKCCDDDVYNMKTHICCGGELHKKRSDEDTLCCGRNSFNSRIEKCCDGEVRLIPDMSDINKVLCCGKEIFDSNKQYCCQNTIYHRNISSQSCCGQTQYSAETGCCAGSPYDPSITMCCNGKILLKTTLSADSCCGSSETYDSRTEICCHGVVQLKVSGDTTQCCNTKSYNPSLYICCEGKTKYRKHNEVSACCGTRVYNPLEENCCNGIITDFDLQEPREKNSKTQIDENDGMEQSDIQRVKLVKKIKKKIRKLKRKLNTENNVEKRQSLQRIVDSLSRRLKKQNKPKGQKETKPTSKVRKRNKIKKLKAILKVYEQRSGKTKDKTILDKVKTKKQNLISKLKKLLRETDNDNEERKKGEKPRKKEILDMLKIRRNQFKKKLFNTSDRNVKNRLKKKINNLEKKIDFFSKPKSKSKDKDMTTNRKLRNKQSVAKDTQKQQINKTNRLKQEKKLDKKERDSRTKRIGERLKKLRSNIKRIRVKLPKVTDQSKRKALLKKIASAKRKIDNLKNKKDFGDHGGIKIKKEKLRRLLQAFKTKLKILSGTKDLRVKKKVKAEIHNIESNIRNLRKQLISGAGDKGKNGDNSKKKRIASLTKKLKKIKKKLSKTTDTKLKKILGLRKRRIQRRLNRLTKNDNSRSNSKNKKGLKGDQFSRRGADERIDILKQKLKDARKKVDKIGNKKARGELKEKDKLQNTPDVKDDNDQDKLKRLVRKYRFIKQQIPKAKNKREKTSLQLEAEKLKAKIVKLRNDKDTNDKNKKEGRKTTKARLDILRRKLAIVKKKLSKTENKSDRNKLREKKEVILRRINRLIRGNESKNNKKNPSKKSKETTNGTNIKNLKKKLKDVLVEIDKTDNKRKVNDLKEKAENLKKKIDTRRKRLRHDETKEDGKDFKKDKTSEGKGIQQLKKELKEIIEKINDTDSKKIKAKLKEKAEKLTNQIRRLKGLPRLERNDNTNEEKLERLIKKVKEIKQQIPLTRNERKRKSLLEEAGSIKKKIDKLRQVEDTNDENKDISGKSNKERLEILRRKLKVIRKNLLKPNSKADERKLLEKREVVQNRINQLTEGKSKLKDRNTNDSKNNKKTAGKVTQNKKERESKEVKRKFNNIEDKLERLIREFKELKQKLPKAKNDKERKSLLEEAGTIKKKIDKIKELDENKDAGGKTNKKRLDILRKKLKVINKKLSKPSDKAAERKLLEMKEVVKNRINQLTGRKNKLKDRNTSDSKNDKKTVGKGTQNKKEPKEVKRKFDENEDKLERLIRKFKELRKKLSETKNDKTRKSLLEEAGTIKRKIDKIKELDDAKDKNKNGRGKTNKERLEILRKKLKVINKKLLKPRNRAAEKQLLEKKAEVKNRINKLTGGKHRLKDRNTNNHKNDKKTVGKDTQNKKETKEVKRKFDKNEKLEHLIRKFKELKQKLSETKNDKDRKSLLEEVATIKRKIEKAREGDDANDENKDGRGKNNNERLDNLRKKLKGINKKLLKPSDRAAERQLLEKKAEVRNRIKQLTGRNDNLKDRDTINRKKDNKSDEKRTQNKKETRGVKSVVDEKEDKLKRLLRKLKELKQKLSKTKNDRERKSILEEIGTIKVKIDKIRELEITNDKNKNGSGKTNKERLDILRKKLKVIEKKLSKPNDKAAERQLLKKKEVIQNRINQLTGRKNKLKDRRTEDNKNDKKNVGKNPQDKKETKEVKSKFDEKEKKLERLISKFKELKQEISEARNERERKSLQDEAGKLKAKINKIRGVENGNKNKQEEKRNLKAKNSDKNSQKKNNERNQSKKEINKSRNKSDLKEGIDVVRRGRLIKKIKQLKQEISKSSDDQKRNSLREEVKKLRAKMKRNRKQYKGGDNIYNRNDKVDAERLKLLLAKLEKIEKRLSKTKEMKNTIQRIIKSMSANKVNDKTGVKYRSKDVNIEKGSSDLSQVKEKHKKIENRISNTEDKLDMQERKKSILDNKIEKKESSSFGKKTTGKTKDKMRNLKKSSDLDQVKEKHKKVENRIDNTKEKLDMQKRKKSILKNKIKGKEGSSFDESEMDINSRLQTLLKYLEKLEIMMSQTSDKKERQILKEDRQQLLERISFLRKELKEADGVSDTESMNDRLARLKGKLEIVMRRLKKEDNRKTIKTLEQKMKILKRRIKGLTNELGH